MLRRPIALAVPALAVAVLCGACRHGEPSRTPQSPTREPPTTPEVIEWLLGEQTRGPRTSNRGANLGILTLDLASGKEAAGAARPQTCAPGLVAFIPLPSRSGDWFGLDETGRLLRHGPDGWSPVPVARSMPALTKLLAITGSPSRLELLVALTKDHREHLAVLVLVGGRITDVQGVDLSALPDRRTALQRYDSGRCVAGTRECLHVTSTDEGTVVTREPGLFEDRVEVTTFEDGGVQDVRYADAAGTKIDVLSPQACAPTPEPSPQPEAAP